MILTPRTPEEVRDAVRAHPRVWLRGSGSKPALSTAPADAVRLDLSTLAAVVEYAPAEYTFTALAGTRIADVAALLAAHGQYLPFDPPLARMGATLGGTVAAGLSGPGRYRFGGARDFVIGVQFVDGAGTLARAGGRVVKNAAGFDLPKLMVGSLGRLAVLTALSFKVFPRPAAYATLRLDFTGLSAALSALVQLTRSSFDLEALDLEPPGRLWIRCGGDPAHLRARLERVRQAVDGEAEVWEGPEERHIWNDARDFTWTPVPATLLKVPLTPKRIPDVDAVLAAAGAQRRYSVGGTLAWVAWGDAPIADLDRALAVQGLSGLVVRGRSDRLMLGRVVTESFARRVKTALDPVGRFPPLPGDSLPVSTSGGTAVSTSGGTA